MILFLMCLVIIAASPLSASAVRHAFDSCRPQNGACKLPEYPANGTYITLHIPDAKPGDTYELVIINITCQDGFVADGSTYITCFNGWWRNKMPKCVPRCHQLPSLRSIVYNCRVFSAVESTRECNEYEPSGTVVSPQCRSSDYYPTTALKDMRCTNGEWDYIARCIPECGTLTPSGEPLIAGGVTAKHGEIPWHAGIYAKDKQPYHQICGGSLISTDIILSAAHCFWSDKGAKLPAAEYAVAVGKLYRPWNENMDTEAQTSDVKEIHLPARFQGNKAHFQDDIAVVKVTESFKYTSFIRPVCIDFDINFQRRQLQPGKKGKVAGWGLTSAEHINLSQVLRVIELPYVSVNTCISEAPPSFSGYITSDKMCAGFRNDGKSVCKGDSGGGLSFPQSDNGTTRYYLRGIVSTAPISNNPCNVNEYTSFTLIQSHENFIEEFWIASGNACNQDGVTGICTNLGECPSYLEDLKNGRTPHICANSAELIVCCLPTGALQGRLPSTPRVLCKEEPLHAAIHSYTPSYSIDDVSRNHYVTLKRNSTGHLMYFEIHFAVQTDGSVGFFLSEKKNYITSIIQRALWVGENSNQRTILHHGVSTVQDIETLGILSSTQLRIFYIKIDDGKLHFGKKGDTPLMSYSDAGLGSLNYYKFELYNREPAKLRYCPVAAVEGSRCKEGSLGISDVYAHTPMYSLDDVSLNHFGALKRNSSGHRTYFELHFDVQTDGVVVFWLSEKEYYLDSNFKFQLIVGEDGNRHTRLQCDGTVVQDILTPEILSWTQFRTFYVKMDEGELQFGKKGDTPLISYYDASYGSIHYYKFEIHYRESAKLRYCPAAV